VVGGALADAWSPASVVTGAGALGLLVVAVLSRTWLRAPTLIDLGADDRAAAPTPAG
jgi:hypothetical protein